MSASNGIIIDLNTAAFDQTIAEGDWAVAFWTSWCSPCRIQTRLLEAGLEEFAASNVNIAKVNVDDEPALAYRFNVITIPTLIIFKGGQKGREMVGIYQPRQIIAAVKEQK